MRLQLSLLPLPLTVVAMVCMTACGKNGDIVKPQPEPTVFVHPGVLISSADITRMKSLVESQTSPAWEAYEELVKNDNTSADYQMRGPFEYLVRDTGSAANNAAAHERDFAAAWMQALRWTVDGTITNADKSLEILYAYATHLKSIDDQVNDMPLCAGFDGFTIAKTAELLRHTGYVESSTDPDVAKKLNAVDTMLVKVFVPTLEWFLNHEAYANGNWGAIITRAYMAIGIHLDNKEMFDRAKEFYLNGEDNGCVKYYIMAETGQCQESGRDQRHAQLGLGALAEVCELAYKQGDETLYAAYDNLLLKGYEYTALYNSGISVPYTAWCGDWGAETGWNTISSSGRGEFLPIYECVYNHYVARKKLNDKAEFTTYVLCEGGGRPETGLSGSNLQYSFGSLVYYQSK